MSWFVKLLFRGFFKKLKRALDSYRGLGDRMLYNYRGISERNA